MLLQTHDLNNPSEIILNVETLVRCTGGKKNPHLNRITKRYSVVVELAMKNLYFVQQNLIQKVKNQLKMKY